MVEKITVNLEKFNYNVIIANMYETYNFLINKVKNNKRSKNLRQSYKKLLICFSPIIPHFSNECLEDLNLDENLNWPEYDKSMIEDENLNIVIQINGKKRLILNEKKGIGESELLEQAKKDKNIKKYLEKKQLKKVIFIKDKLINILIND